MPGPNVRIIKGVHSHKSAMEEVADDGQMELTPNQQLDTMNQIFEKFMKPPSAVGMTLDKLLDQKWLDRGTNDEGKWTPATSSGSSSSGTSTTMPSVTPKLSRSQSNTDLGSVMEEFEKPAK